MGLRFVTVLGAIMLAVVTVSATGGCNATQPTSTAAPAPAATTDQPQGAPTSTGAQAPAVPESAEPAGSQVQFK